MRIDVDAEGLGHHDEVVQVALPVPVNCLRGSLPATSNSHEPSRLHAGETRQRFNAQDVTACNELGLNTFPRTAGQGIRAP